MTSIVNLQKEVRLDTKPFRQLIDLFHDSVTEAVNKEFTVAFVSNRRMIELNKIFRCKDSITDVLSFPYEPDEFDPKKNNLGDIVISAEQAQKQADENGLTLEAEIKQLILHGLLHLCGYDHESDNGEMNAREWELREEIGI
ncbi:MAG: rRNA maturation RNase YbeY [Pyrinomonadaceae bacterium]|nr:rRNA maturation RNase YbeY [Blastocatellia bacterium]MDQ3490686.1 rRNA maturation RNase YbeY [Acidobacteriota bacterium]